jgi:hypothetical protein
MDRETANLPKSQSGFISFLVLPLYQAFVQEFPEAKVALDQVEENLNHWKQQCTN